MNRGMGNDYQQHSVTIDNRSLGKVWLRGLFSVGLLMVILSGVLSGPVRWVSAQAELTVCASGCDYTTIQGAIDAAAPDDLVKIAAGAYSEPLLRNGSTQIAYLEKNLTLQGGYSPDFSVRDLDLYPTTLNAQGLGRVVYAAGSVNVTLDGLRLVNGHHSSAGGGVYSTEANLRILSSRIENNRLSPSFHGDYGVGLFQSGGSLYMENSVVQGNQPIAGGDNSHMGGGLYGIDAKIEIRSSQFLNNTAAFGNISWDSGTGGGANLENCTSSLQGVTFRGNVATDTNGGGGGLWLRSGSLSLQDSTFEGNTNGGAMLFTDGLQISGNIFNENIGAGLRIGSWSTPLVATITIAGNSLNNNTGGGLMINNPILSLVVENNAFVGNQNGGLKFSAKSDTGTASAVIVRGNLFQANTTTVNGGGAWILGAADVLNNRFIGNHANGKGGAIYQGETSRFDNASAVYDGNLLRGNSAAEGGGLYSRPEFSENLNINYQNMVLIDNTATITGSAIVFYRYAKAPVTFKHLTLSGNTGGDGAMIYHVMGSVSYENSIIANAAVGFKINSGYKMQLDHILRYNVTTPLSGASVPDLSPVTGDPAFDSDGYHLTAASAALDAGIDVGVIDDIDQNPRPLGTAPDLGADESPYSLVGSGLQASLLASAPQWKIYFTGSNAPPSTYLEQNYLIPYAYYAANNAPQVSQYTLTDNFPAGLDLSAVTYPANLDYTRTGNVLTWTSQQPLLPGDWGWLGLNGRSETVAGGQELTNTGQMAYTMAGGASGTIPLSTGSTVPPRPVFAPMLITPLDGEICLDTGNQLSAKGVAGAGMTVRLYEDDILKAETTASGTGEFTLNWTTALTDTHAIVIYTKACEPGGTNCSLPSTSVHLVYPQADWCPQRSYWEGDAFGLHHIFYFRNDLGRYASNDFVLPGVYGFWNTKLHLFSCCDQNDINPFKVTADNTVYQTPSAHDGRWWTFDIGAAHQVTVESQCQGGGGTPPPAKKTGGQVLIDPDGFIFDVNQGGGFDLQTGMFAPNQALAGMTITAYEFVPEWQTWIQWPAQLYGQINPQVTGDSGYFAFFTPPGLYYLQVDAGNGYQSWRSPTIEVVSEIVHVNVPLTPTSASAQGRVSLTSNGPQPELMVVPVGGSVEWVAALPEFASAADLARLNDVPIHHPYTRMDLDPLLNSLGFDGGMLKPGQVYRRQFNTLGTYSYNDGQGHTGVILVGPSVYLPLVKR